MANPAKKCRQATGHQDRKSDQYRDPARSGQDVSVEHIVLAPNIEIGNAESRNEPDIHAPTDYFRTFVVVLGQFKSECGVGHHKHRIRQRINRTDHAEVNDCGRFS